MEKVSATYRLIRRGGVYYRRRVPTHLVETIGKEVIQQSLNTTCPIQGRKLRVGEASNGMRVSTSQTRTRQLLMAAYEKEYARRVESGVSWVRR
jgi:hypothetical protein